MSVARLKRHSIRHLLEKKLAGGQVAYYWNPSKTLRALPGVEAEALGSDYARAATRALLLNDWADALRAGEKKRPKRLPRKAEEERALAVARGLHESDWPDIAKGIGTLYFLHSPRARAVKIGFTFELQRRVMALQTSSPVPLVLLAQCPGTRDSEKALHRKFASIRLSGEWFKAHKRLMDYIAGIQK